MKIRINKVKENKSIEKGGHVKLDINDHIEAVKVYFAPDDLATALYYSHLICDIPEMIELIKNYDREKALKLLHKYSIELD